jgi:hypothetical protein
MAKRMTQAELKDVLHYNPDTGVFTWIVSHANHVKSGDIAGGVVKTPSGRKRVKIETKGNGYLAHRLAYLYMLGYMPRFVGHRNGDALDNRWCNLRDDSSMKGVKQARNKNNKSSIRGVCFCSGKWVAYIQKSGKNMRLYNGPSKHDAIIARYRAEVELGWHESNSDTDAKRYVESLSTI